MALHKNRTSHNYEFLTNLTFFLGIASLYLAIAHYKLRTESQHLAHLDPSLYLMIVRTLNLIYKLRKFI